MSDGGRESTPRGYCHRLKVRGGMEGLGCAEFWTKRGKFYNHVGKETLVRRRGLHAAQRPTYDQLDKARIRVRDENDGEAACRRHQRLPGKSEGPAGRTTSNLPCGIWPEKPSTTLLTKTEL